MVCASNTVPVGGYPPSEWAFGRACAGWRYGAEFCVSG